jgi:hypothetical protein
VRGPEPSLKPGVISRRRLVPGAGAACSAALAACGRLPWRRQENPDHRAEALCRELTERWAAPYTFARIEGSEMTINLSERGLRPAVLWGKGGFELDSEAGRRFAE